DFLILSDLTLFFRSFLPSSLSMRSRFLFLLLPLLVFPAAPLYFNNTDWDHATCWPVDMTHIVTQPAVDLIKYGYEYFGTIVETSDSRPCLKWRDVTTTKDDEFATSGTPSLKIDEEYYKDHAQCRWLPMILNEK
ncbi:hypothetical protein PFISCL1PPCAC_21734, partial [Pristionchus fissidentatus]